MTFYHACTLKYFNKKYFINYLQWRNNKRSQTLTCDLIFFFFYKLIYKINIWIFISSLHQHMLLFLLRSTLIKSDSHTYFNWRKSHKESSVYTYIQCILKAFISCSVLRYVTSYTTIMYILHIFTMKSATYMYTCVIYTYTIIKPVDSHFKCIYSDYLENYLSKTRCH